MEIKIKKENHILTISKIINTINLSYKLKGIQIHDKEFINSTCLYIYANY